MGKEGSSTGYHVQYRSFRLAHVEALSELPSTSHLTISFALYVLMSRGQGGDTLIQYQTVKNIIIHAGSDTTTPNCREHKRKLLEKNVKAMRNNLRANAPTVTFTPIEYTEGHRSLFLM